MTLTARIEARRPQPEPGRFLFSFPDPAATQEAAAAEVGAFPQAVLGIQTVSLTPKLAEMLNLREHRGILVADVELRKVRGRMELEVGDVILSVDGRPVESPAAFASHLRSRRPGAKVALKLIRGGEERLVTIQLPAAPPRRH